ncbi:lactonase family protein [Noviherbaspirillum saxi]|uniref:Lactonase family protein n=2 Tax=Noviherbaspirillum saxi TaxID=2320863 RepID=A0A3A3FP56_9BURK|nr:lactonase family protein [Noviherbaspirillum saxi]
MYAYVGSRTTRQRNAQGNGVNVYAIDAESGKWTHLQLVGDLVNPSFLALGRDHQTLYTVHGDMDAVSALAIDAKTGLLRFLNQQSTGGSNPVHLVTDPANRLLIVANYATGSIATLPLSQDGSLEPLNSLIEVIGPPGPHKTQQTSPHPHQAAFDPSGRYVVVPDKGVDTLFVFRFEPDSGNLVPEPLSQVKARSGAGPRHIAFHPTLPYAYVMNELDSSVTAYRFDADSGRLTPLQIIPTIPSNYFGDNTGAAITVSSSGRFLYASNRGHDSILQFSVDEGTGELTQIGWTGSQGICPRFMCLDPDGLFMYVANESSHTIVQFHIHQETGHLAPSGQVIGTGSPVSIVFATPNPGR